MTNASMLRVEKLFDWEHGGFLSPGMEREPWCIKGRGHHDLFKNKKLIDDEVVVSPPARRPQRPT